MIISSAEAQILRAVQYSETIKPAVGVGNDMMSRCCLASWSMFAVTLFLPSRILVKPLWQPQSVQLLKANFCDKPFYKSL